MPQRGRTLSPGRSLVVLVIFIGVWLDSYQLARFFLVAEDVSAWYPPSGVSLAFTLVFGPLYWPLEIIAPLFQGFIDDGKVDSGELATVVRQVVLYGGSGVLLRNLLRVRVPFQRARGVRLFFVVAMIASGLSAIFALLAGTLPPLERMRSMARMFMSLWIGDLSGCLFSAPVMVAMFSLLAPRLKPAPGDWRIALSLPRISGLSLVILVAAGIFFLDRTFQTSGEPWLFVLIPIYIYALTHGFGAAVLGIVAIDLSIIIFHRLSGRMGDPVYLQMFVMMVGTASLLIGASISERHQSETRLRRAERKQAELATRNLAFAAAIDATPIGVAITDADRTALRVQYANPALCQLLETDHPIGSGLVDLIDNRVFGESRAAVDALRRIVIEKEHGSVELALGPAAPRHTAFIIAPIRRDRRLIAFVAVAADITEHYQRATEERDRERLVSLGHLAGGIAHEINNLLHPIVNLAVDAIDDQADGPRDVREQLRIIETCGRKAGEIVRNILRFARGSSRVDGQSIVVEKAVADAIAINRQALPPGVMLEFHSSAPGATAAVGETEVVQVMTNLIRNAIQAIAGGGRIDVRLEVLPVENETARLRLSIADSGSGMDESTRQRLFDPFFTTRSVGEGTGLGLSVVHGIVRDWCGYITVTSEPGRGSVFSIVFPAATV